MDREPPIVLITALKNSDGSILDQKIASVIQSKSCVNANGPDKSCTGAFERLEAAQQFRTFDIAILTTAPGRIGPLNHPLYILSQPFGHFNGDAFPPDICGKGRTHCALK